jgi:hypothetical protein
MSFGLSLRNLTILNDFDSFRSASTVDRDQNHPINFVMYICYALTHKLFIRITETEGHEFDSSNFIKETENEITRLIASIPHNQNDDWTGIDERKNDFIHSINFSEKLVCIIDRSNRAWPLILNDSAGFQFRNALGRVLKQLDKLVTSFMCEIQINENQQLEPRQVRAILDNDFAEILNIN